jgi:putative peptidoglycan lipid II flippase
VAGFAQLVWLALVLKSAGMGLRFRLPRLTPEVKRLLVLMLPVALGAGVYQINVVVDVAIASFLPAGSVSFLYYADRLNQLPLGVVGIAIGTALLPILARQIRAGDDGAALANQNRALEVALVLTLPAAAALIVIAQPIIAVLFERGAFGAAEVDATALALAAYAVGLPAHVLAKVFTPGYFAREDTATPVKIAVAVMVINAGLAVSLMLILRGYGIGHMGIALATSVTGWLNAVLLWRGLVRRGQFSLDSRLRRRVLPILLAAVVMAGALVIGHRLLAPWLAGSLHERVVALALLIAAGSMIYGIAAQLLGAVNLRELKSQLRPRRGVSPSADTES